MRAMIYVRILHLQVRIFVENVQSLITMDRPLQSYAMETALVLVFIFGLLHVHGSRSRFMTRDFPETVLHTINLECHTIHLTSRSSLELAIMCGGLASCLGMKRNKDFDTSEMLCSCSDGPILSEVTSLAIGPMTHLLTHKDVTLSG